MEESQPLRYLNQITDAKPTVDANLPERASSSSLNEPLDEYLVPYSSDRYLRDDLDPYIQDLGGLNFTRTPLQTVKAFPRHTRELICSERVNILLVFVPIGVTIGFLNVDPIVDFVFNALAIIPLAVVISTATESIASRLGDTLGALLNVTVGNTAELMIFFIALAKNQIRIVQASLLGSIIANLLLVLGTAFWSGGLRYANQLQDRPAAHLSVGLLDFGLLVSMFPIAFLVALRHTTPAQIRRETLGISRGTSIGLIIIYVFYLVFEMREQASARVSNRVPTHGVSSFQMSTIRRGRHRAGSQVDESASSLLRRSLSLERLEPNMNLEVPAEEGGPWRSRSVGAKPNYLRQSPEELVSRFDWQDVSSTNHRHIRNEWRSDSSVSDYEAEASTLRSTLPPSPPSTPPSPSGPRFFAYLDHDEFSTVDPRNKKPLRDAVDRGRMAMSQHMSHPAHRRQNTLEELWAYRRARKLQSQTPLPVAVGVLIFATGLVSICTEHAVDAIPSMVESWGVSQIFLGFIVLPVVGNAAEHIIAAKLAMHNKMVLAKKVAVESSAQIVLFIMPMVVLIGWVRNLDMSLQFDIFEIASIVMTSVVASILVCRGKGDWKQGLLLHSIFLIVAFGAVIYPAGR